MLKEAAIGDLLVRAGLIDSTGLTRALEVQEQKGLSLGKALATLGLADEEVASAAIARTLRMEVLRSELPDVTEEVSALLPADFCRTRMVAPLSLDGNALRLALTNPLDYSTIQDVEFRTNKRVVVVVGCQTLIEMLLNKVYPAQSQAALNALDGQKPKGEVEALQDAEFELVDPSTLAKGTKLPPVIRLVNMILSTAARDGASDIHLEPKENYLQARQRVDGLLHEVVKVPKQLQDATISRLKILSGMDIADRRRPQDGRSRLRYEGKRIDLRVSTLPTQFGEKMVIRLLDSRRAQLTMEQLEMTPENLRTFQAMLSRPQGMILVTGPTGSGKSSTLYTALNWVKSSTKNIITVEDPIEYQLDGVNQVQINTRAGVTFAAGLRSILRQDPNVILVGEIRDQETAGIALEAAQTGHLLLSTVHTNDAPATISRLLDLGIEPFLISSALIGILGQRLVRRPCPSCAVPLELSPELIQKAGGLGRLPGDGKWVAGRGCEACRQSGYKGRLGIHELLQVNEEVRELITRRASEHAIRKAARTAGMRTILEDGILKAAQGFTTLEDVLRVAATDGDAAHKEESTKPATPELAFPAKEDPPPVTASRSTPVEESAGTVKEDSTPPAAASADSPPRDSAEKQRVLVVEDSRTIVAVVKYFLELEGFGVLVAGDGIAGLEVAKRERPDVIVTDRNMPGMDGLTMVKELRADPQTRHIAVLMLTSDSAVEKEAQALAAGADDYIVKPVEPRRLAARVKAVLARSAGRLAANLK